MGFWGSAASRVRGLLRFDKDNIAISLAKGATGSLSPTSGFDLLQSYGYDAMSDYLKLDQDLVTKYIDYESFDDYPETHCLSGESLVMTVEYGWTRIEKLA